MLITGGYGFIGSHVADRFKKEGYDIFIIDNLAAGHKENINFKHKSYLLSVEDEKCEEVYRANSFDVVVHLAAQVSVAASVSNPALDSDSNVTGFVNMLDLSRKYKVKKFIYASSAAVYGASTALPISESEPCAPISPYGISKWVGESYAAKWHELYDLHTLGFRFSNVYGPRQNAHGEGGVISVFMSRMLAEQSLVIHGDGRQTRDFIYVEDVADAIYRASNSTIAGIYNLSTGTENSVLDVANTLSAIGKVKDIAHRDKRQGDIERSSLDNNRIQRDLDWAPKYLLEEGLQHTYGYFLNMRSSRESAASKAAQKPQAAEKAWKKGIPYAENVILFALAAWLTLSQQYSTYGVIDVKLFYITIMGIMYGSRQSILAVLLSTGLYVYQKLENGMDLVSLLYVPDFLFPIAIYLFIGLVVGYAIERKNAIIRQNEQNIDDLEYKYRFLNGVYQDVREVKEELQSRILNAGDSYGKIYSVTKELESLEPELVFNATVNVVESIMDAPHVSIYTANGNQSYLRLVAQSSDAAGSRTKSLRVEEHAYLRTVMREGKLYINKVLEEGVPLMCAPIFYKNKIAAVIAIDGLTFEKFSLYHQNLFKTTIDLVTSSLSKALAYIEATEGQRFVEGTPILKREAFQSILASKKKAWEKNRIPYLLLKGDVGQAGLEEMGNKINGMLRETDYTGLGEGRDVLVLLSNTDRQDADHVLNRFTRNGITLAVVNEGA